jgi:hypothetical protein
VTLEVPVLELVLVLVLVPDGPEEVSSSSEQFARPTSKLPANKMVARRMISPIRPRRGTAQCT